MSEIRAHDRERRLMLLGGWLLVVLVLVGSLLWSGGRSRDAVVVTQLAQAAEQLVIQANLARGQWLMSGRPTPLLWAPAGEAQTSASALRFDNVGSLQIDGDQGCDLLWQRLLRRPLDLGNQYPVRASNGGDDGEKYCDFVVADQLLRWWPASGRTQLTTEATK